MVLVYIPCSRPNVISELFFFLSIIIGTFSLINGNRCIRVSCCGNIPAFTMLLISGAEFFFTIERKTGGVSNISINYQSKARRSTSSSYTGFVLHVLVCGSLMAEHSREAVCVMSMSVFVTTYRQGSDKLQVLCYSREMLISK